MEANVAGRPGRLPWIGDPFGEWSDDVRSALVWLGKPDPVDTMRQARERDIHRAALAALFQAMWNVFGSEPHTAGEIIEYAQTGALKKSKLLDRPLNGGDADLKAAIVGYISGKLEAQHFGNKLGIDRDRIVGDLRLASDYDGNRKVNRWFIEKLR